jgi:hypothetical protein
MFFVRLDEWGWDEAPPKVPMFPGDLPRQDHPLPKALDDASAAKLLRAAQGDKRLLVRVTVEMLLRTGLRVSEYTSLRAGAVVQIGAGPWLHVPVGKLRQDRYLPLHPSSSPSSTATGPPTSRPGTRCCCPAKTDARWTATLSPGSSTRPAPPPACRTSTPTNCATPWHPGHQPRHEPGSHRRAAGPPQPRHDPALRENRQPHRR